MPPSYLKLARKPSPRSSTKSMRRPFVRNAISRKRCSSTEPSKSSASKMSRSGKKVIEVPCRSVWRALDEIGLGDAALVALGPLVAVAVDAQLQPFGQPVDDRHADAVQPARDLVAAAVTELAAGVQHGQDHLGRRTLLLLHHRDGDAAAVVGHGDRAVGMDGDDYVIGLAGQRLVDGVVDDLIDEVVKAPDAGRADVHAGALADCLEALEDGDVRGVVSGLFVLCVVVGQYASVDVRSPDALPSKQDVGACAASSHKDSRETPRNRP